ncbi:MAG: carboxylating nicotinate-nucleotide diphosphorylase [Deltaproteobacteria bacterium]|jgi:nicotinate-nucleotide pyrophosphorylase (carboxylating)|nr:carboxylating nicotinate-nucleotide diphosphorylase [Deltaproteobacteria bacterium]MBT4265791.1 carboxylating nicotinate-nucleotide diphosphorylase [Deltaproteobacteria bacterium]MBT4638340.1 carboxylating nicotinate-nucleotide diphosphorylase [Deltaproteobacteria bacterium]MBT6504200.1 carboxylating nicotinate-nucleotide diphosphorylase [Deltaproteobacteria bacterium]MBT6613500.1 carboxylating nicotinate-nucleotide diphosphorylase [Deltaproteobacteria bacterium]
MDFRQVDRIIEMALNEDLPWGDVTSETIIDPDLKHDFVILLKADGVIAGLPVAERTFRHLEPDLDWEPILADGASGENGEILVRLRGRTRKILMAERVALNILQRLSGIATLTSKYVIQARKKSAKVRITDTRKTTPGLRYLEKYAVRMGGGHNHRYSLSDAVMLKDNHLAILKQEGISLQDAIERIKNRLTHTSRIEVEVDALDQISEVVEAGADCILLDNMDPETLLKAVRLIDGRTQTEASGGVSLESVESIAATGVDLISSGALTHSAIALDISLDFAE